MTLVKSGFTNLEGLRDADVSGSRGYPERGRSEGAARFTRLCIEDVDSDLKWLLR